MYVHTGAYIYTHTSIPFHRPPPLPTVEKGRGEQKREREGGGLCWFGFWIASLAPTTVRIARVRFAPPFLHFISPSICFFIPSAGFGCRINFVVTLRRPDSYLLRHFVVLLSTGVAEETSDLCRVRLFISVAVIIYFVVSCVHFFFIGEPL